MSAQTQFEEAIKQIVGFVEGATSAEDFCQIFETSPILEACLKNDPELRPGTYIGSNTHDFILQEIRTRPNCWARPGSLLNIHGALSQFLDRHKISCKPTKQYSETYNLILSSQPKWLDVDDRFFKEKILSVAPQLPKAELKKWLKEQLLKMFKYTGKPPKWIQNPNWPIGENGPLVFLGQLKVENYFHDAANIYIFHDQTTGSIQTVVQVF